MSDRGEDLLRRLLAGASLPRPPYSLWGHDWVREQSLDGLEAATFAMVERVQPDFVKLNPRFTLFVEDFGATFRTGNHRPEPAWWPVREAADLRRLPRLDPRRGVLGQHTGLLARIRDRLDPGIPVIQTLFTPLVIVRDLAGKREADVVRWMAEDPASLHEGLKRVTDLYVQWVRRTMEAGAAGIFLATTVMATRRTLSPEQYAVFGRPYDLEVLEAIQAEGGWWTVFHVCQPDALFDAVAAYPVPALSWAAGEGSNPGLAEGRARSGRIAVGGVPVATMLQGTPGDVRAAVAAARRELPDGLVLGPSCTIDPATPLANLEAFREACQAP